MAERPISEQNHVAFWGGTYEHDDNPLTGRSRFSRRHLYNWRKAVLSFTTLAIAFAVFVPWLEWFGDAAVGIVLWYLLFYVWDKEPIWIKCNHCGKMITSKTPWVCGLNGCKNEQTDDFPFLYKCEHCGTEPKAYKCHHCKNLIFLTADQQKEGYATSASDPVRNKAPKFKPVEDENTQRLKRKAKLEWDILEARLETELAQENARRKVAKGEKKPIGELFAEEREAKVGDMEAFRREKALIKEKYKDDPELLEMMETWLEDFKNHHVI